MPDPLPHVVITDFINDSLEVERNVLDGIATVEALDAYNEQQLEGRIDSAAAVMLYHNLGLSAQSIRRLNDC